VANLGTPISKEDAERVALNRFQEEFPEIELTNELLSAIIKKVITAKHTDRLQSIQTWNGQTACRPDVDTRLIPCRGAVTVNTFSVPSYRTGRQAKADLRLFMGLLHRTMPHEADRTNFMDWLSWCLQNEADKPNHAIFLFSDRKGTGKSTIADLCARLFGRSNSIVQNNIVSATA
jgi:hypothetical protein